MLDIRNKIRAITLLKVFWYPFGYHKNKITNRIYRYIFIISPILTIITQAMYVLKNYHLLEKTAGTCYLLFALTGDIIKLTIFNGNLELIEESLEMLQIKEFQPKNSNERSIIERGIRLTNLLCYSFCILGFLTIVTILSIPFLNRNEKKLPFNAWFPYNELDSILYVFTYLWQCHVIVSVAASGAFMDMTFIAFMTQIGAQCDILNQNVESLVKNEQTYDLRKCINHHRLILKYFFFDKIRNFK